MLPIENQRVKEVINFTTKGNELQFSREIGISQPRINRLFTIDKRSGNYPLVSFEIVQAIINKFLNISAEWLLTGNGEMLKGEVKKEVQPSSNSEVEALLREKMAMLEKNNALLEENNALQKEKIKQLEQEILALKKLGITKNADKEVLQR